LGYSAVRVHARTVEQKYQGTSRWEFLRQIKMMYPNRTILGSGDVFTAEDAVRMLRETGVDIVWIARGAIGNPWIFRHAAALLPLAGGERVGVRGEIRNSQNARNIQPAPLTPALSPQGERELAPPSIHEQRQALQEHFAIAMEIHGEQLAGRRMRKMGIKYARFHPNAIEVKTEFINVRSLRDWNNVLEKWYAADGPGVWPDPKAADEVNDALEESPTQPSCQAIA
jgi:tRNA-dihydrouridine synthase